jgi:hypothetical protein
MRTTASTFNDVLILPKFSTITDLTKIDLSTDLGADIQLKIPIVGNNMAIAEAGGLYLLPKRVCNQDSLIELSTEELANQITTLTLNAKNPLQLGITIGASERDRERAIACIDAGIEIICIEENFGANQEVVDQVIWFRDKYKDSIFIIAGCFIVGQTIADFRKACGKDKEPNLYKVRASIVLMNEMGVGLPIVNAIGDCSRVAPIIVELRVTDIEKNISKALAQGAKAIQFFDGTTDRFTLGTKPLAETLEKINYNLRLACKTVNANNLTEFAKNAELVLISSMAACQVEYESE